MFYLYFTCALLCYWCSGICFSFIFVFLVAANCSLVALGNNILSIYNDIMFPSLLVTTLYDTIIMILFDDV